MNLKNKFVLWCAILLGGLLVVGGLSLWNLAALWRSTSAANAEYEAMDHAEAAVAKVQWLRDSLLGIDAQNYIDVKFFSTIQTEVNAVIGSLKRGARVNDGDAPALAALLTASSEQLETAMSFSAESSGTGAARAGNAPQAATELEKLRQSMVAVGKIVPGSARHHVAAASDGLLQRLIWSGVVFMLILAISIAIHLVQYRTLIRPMLWLRDGMKRSAANNYLDAVPLRGDKEFKEVAGFFNGLARDLADLYRNLEQKVITRSRELVRSERLASVGFLAAGVAHEINNPLSVISGYAELAGNGLRRLVLGSNAGADSRGDAEEEAQALTSALDAQDIIRDEAFRCKEITSRLLSLARGGTSGREAVHLDELARHVAVLIKGMNNYRDRRVVLEFESNRRLEVFANPTEMKQVLLNLTVNALEAVGPDRGEVRIAGRRNGPWVELSVQDTGKGMSPKTLEQIFEPFFTAKGGVNEPGTGLGLSITHAIVESHGGRIQAESDGLGMGSKFTFSIPARSASVSEGKAVAALS